MKRLISIILIIAAITSSSYAGGVYRAYSPDFLEYFTPDSKDIPPIIDSGYADEVQDDGNLFGLPFFTSVDPALRFDQFIEDPVYPMYWPEDQLVIGDIEVLGRTASLYFEFPTEEEPEIVTEIMFKIPLAEASILYEEVFDLCVKKWGQPDSGQAWFIRSEDTSSEWIEEKADESISVEQVVKGEVEKPVYYEYTWRTDEQHRYEMMIYKMYRGIQTITIRMSLGF